MNPAPLSTRLLPRLRRLLPAGSRVVVATSGGPDSQALLHLIATHARALRLAEVIACGIDHGLRPEAPRELDLAERLARPLGVDFVRRRISVPRSGNLLADARRARYVALREVVEARHASRLAVAHTATDQAETVLWHLVRGAGLKGASGMPARRGPLVRPLLEVTREEVLAYLHQHDVPFATDPSNTDRRRMRAALRTGVLPRLAELNPQAVLNLARFATRARRDDRLLRAQARAHLHTRYGALALRPLQKLPAPLASRAVTEWLRGHGLTAYARHVDQLCAGETVRLAQGRRVGASRDYLWLLDRPAPLPAAMELGVPIVWPWPKLELRARLAEPAEVRELETGVAKLHPTRVAFDADTLHLRLQARTSRAGETFTPFGLHGTVKVRDLFTNMKLPTPLRSHWPLVVCGREILWVVGLRRGAAAPITAATRRVLLLEVAPSEDGPLHPFNCAK